LCVLNKRPIRNKNVFSLDIQKVGRGSGWKDVFRYGYNKAATLSNNRQTNKQTIKILKNWY